MSLQLTRDQEQRIRTLVDSGAYRTAEEALDATVAAVEMAANVDFDGRHEELAELVLEGLASGEPIEVDAAFLSKLGAETDQMAAQSYAKNT